MRIRTTYAPPLQYPREVLSKADIHCMSAGNEIIGDLRIMHRRIANWTTRFHIDVGSCSLYTAPKS